MMMPRAGARALNALRKELMPCKASHEGSIAILGLRSLPGLCKAEASRFTISQLSPTTQPPTAVYALSRCMWRELSTTTRLWVTREVVMSGTWVKPPKQWD